MRVTVTSRHRSFIHPTDTRARTLDQAWFYLLGAYISELTHSPSGTYMLSGAGGKMAIHKRSKREYVSVNILCERAMRKLSRDREGEGTVSEKGVSKLTQ